MNFLSRKVRTQEIEGIQDRVIHREIEITVQREWISVTGGARSAECGELLPSQLIGRDEKVEDALLQDERKSHS